MNVTWKNAFLGKNSTSDFDLKSDDDSFRAINNIDIYRDMKNKR